MRVTPPAAAPSFVPLAVALAAVYLIWGSTYFAIAIGLTGFPPFLMGGLRFVVAASLMFALGRAKGQAWPTPMQWRNTLVMGGLLLVLGNGLVNVAEQQVSSGVAAIAVASMPLWAGVFGWLRGHHPSRGEWLGLCVGFVGVLWLNAGSELRASTQGMLALIAAPIAWAFGSVWGRGRDLPAPFINAGAQMLCGGVLMLLLAALLGERMLAWPALRPTLAVAYLVVFGSIVAFSAYLWLLQHVRPALATSYAYINPPVAVLLGVLFLGEPLDPHALGAMVVILLGVVVITLARAKAS